jgi:hypothetical protein
VADQQTLAEERLAAKSVDIATIQAAYGRTSASDAPEGEAATTEPSDASPGAEAPEIAQAETGTDGEQQTLDTPDKPASSRPKRTSREGNTAQEGSA